MCLVPRRDASGCFLQGEAILLRVYVAKGRGRVHAGGDDETRSEGETSGVGERAQGTDLDPARSNSESK